MEKEGHFFQIAQMGTNEKGGLQMYDIGIGSNSQLTTHHLPLTTHIADVQYRNRDYTCRGRSRPAHAKKPTDTYPYMEDALSCLLYYAPHP